jgi:MFS family permease
MYLSIRNKPPLREDEGAPDALARRDVKQRRWVSSTVIGLGLTSLFTDVSSEMVAAVLPLYLASQLGLSSLMIGLLDGLHQIFTVVLRPLGGRLADRSRRYKEVAASGYALSAMARLGLVALGGSTQGVMASQFTDRLGKGIRTAPRDAAISLTTPSERLAAAFGVHRAMDTVGALSGPLLAFVILGLARQSFDAVFVFSVGFAVVGLAMLLLLVRNPSAGELAAAGIGCTGVPTPRGGERRRERLRADLRAVWALSAVRSLTLVGSLLALATVGDAFLYLALRERIALTDRWFPLLFAGTAVTYLALAVPVGWLADRVGRRPVLLAGYGLLVAAYLSAALVPGGFGLGLTLVLLGAYYAATDGVFTALVSAATPAAHRTSGLAVVTTGVALARFVAALCFGGLVTVAGFTTALSVFAMLMAAAVLIAHRRLRRLEGAA